jgi:hypothetical protein
MQKAVFRGSILICNFYNRGKRFCFNSFFAFKALQLMLFFSFFLYAKNGLRAQKSKRGKRLTVLLLALFIPGGKY